MPRRVHPLTLLPATLLCLAAGARPQQWSVATDGSAGGAVRRDRRRELDDHHELGDWPGAVYVARRDHQQ